MAKKHRFGQKVMKPRNRGSKSGQEYKSRLYYANAPRFNYYNKLAK